MAVVHISKTEAARDPEGMLARAWSGDEVVIDYGDGTLALTRQTDLSPALNGPGPTRDPFDLLDEKIARNGNDRSYIDSGEFLKDLLAAAHAPRPPIDEETRKAKTEEFIALMKSCGREAAANGMTEEILQEILRDGRE
jgi:hypothetical protein